MRLRLALREIRSGWRFSAAFAFSLGFGFFGFLFLNAFHSMVRESFESRSKLLLSADFSVSAQRELTSSEESMVRSTLLELAPAGYAETRVLETYSMLATADGKLTRLTEAVAIQDAYPLYGQLRLRRAGAVSGHTRKSVVSSREIWMSQELAVQMGLVPGDSVRLGGLTFKVADVVEEDSATSWRGFSLAPRIYMGFTALHETDLIQKGSRVGYRRFYRLNSDADVARIAAELNGKLVDPGVTVRSHLESGGQAGRAFDYLTDFLGLVALVGLFLASLGGAYLFQSFVSRRLSEIATLMTLGLSARGSVQVYMIQLGLLGAAAALLASVFAWVGLRSVVPFMRRYLEIPLNAGLGAEDVVTVLAVGVIGANLACLPFLQRIRTLKPAVLFQESGQPVFFADRASALSAFPGLLFFYGLSVWQAHSWVIGSFFFFGLLLSGALLAVIALGVIRLGAARGERPATGSIELRVAGRYLLRNRFATVSAFLAVGLGSVLIYFLPQIQASIESEIESPSVSRIPSLFLFDIQDEQVEPLRRLALAEQVDLDQLTPMIRARLESVNGKPFEKSLNPDDSLTREGERSARSRNRGYNLTYREGLTESESLLKGRIYSGPATPGDAEVSVEYRFADRMGLKIGDQLRFDVQGVAVNGRITSLRKVKWTSFQPNFFIVFQPGVLEQAPKTHLASIRKLDLEARARVQNRIVEAFPNISIVDVTALVGKLLAVFEQMALALRAMAALSVLTGLVVLFSIASHQARERRYEIQLLKILGASHGFISRVFWFEFGGIGFLASLFGVGVGAALSFAASWVFFDSNWAFAVGLPMGIVGAVTALTLITTHFAVRRSLAEKPRV